VRIASTKRASSSSGSTGGAGLVGRSIDDAVEHAVSVTSNRRMSAAWSSLAPHDVRTAQEADAGWPL